MFQLAIEKRDIIGKASKRLDPKKMAAIYYGGKVPSTPVVVSKNDFKKVFKQAGESAVITLKDGDRELEALIYDVDFDPIKDEPRHADFYIIEKGKKVKIKVPIQFEGVAGAVKNLGGILVKVLHEIEVEALPKDLPQHIVADVSSLDTLESQLLLKQIAIPLNVTALVSPDEVVASITLAKEEKVEEVPVDLGAIEVEKKGKKEEEGAEAPAADGTAVKGEKPKESKGEEKK